MRRSPFIHLLLFWALSGLAASPASGVVTFEREGKTLKKLTIDCGSGKLFLVRKAWNNTRVVTESGRIIEITDPFMYTARATKNGKKVGSYWNRPQVWDTWEVREVEVPERPRADIVLITAEQPGLPLKKEVVITVEQKENIAYVFNRIVATKDLQLDYDRQCIYVSRPSAHKFYVDGTEITPEDGRSVAVYRWVIIHRPADDVSAALIFIDRKIQDPPVRENGAFGSFTFHVTQKAKGAEIGWRKGGEMVAGASQSQQYIIMWGDGDLREKVEAVSEQALGGKLNSKVHALPALPKPVTMEDLIRPSTELRADEIQYGEWLPLRMQPTKSRATHQHSTYLSPYNALQANKILDGLRKKKPMLLVRGPFGRLIIGKEDGLIHGVRPHILSASYQGSYLREYAEGWEPKGLLAIREQSPEKILLNWKGGDASRSITIYADGLVESSWRNGPNNLEIFTGCHPYHFISSDGKTATRFSQLLQRKRKLEGLSRFALFGYRNASLEIKARGLECRSEEIWLDPGEVGWEWVTAYAKEHPKQPHNKLHRPFWTFMRKNAALTYLAGGAIRRMEFAADGRGYDIAYRIGERGRSAMADVHTRKFHRKTTPKEEPHLVRVRAAELWTWRVWPNEFNGWELRPLKQVQINPLPAFYEMTLRNDSDAERSFTFRLDKAAWMESAVLESDREVVQPLSKKWAPRYRQQPFWTDRGSPTVVVSAGKSKLVLLRLKPVEQTLGERVFSINWSSGEERGSVPLKVRVVPNIIVDPHGNPGMAAEDFRYFGCTGYLQSMSVVDGADEYLDLRGQEILRNGKWGWIWVGMRGFIKSVHDATQQSTERGRQALEERVRRAKETKLDRAAQAPYRYRLHMADEIWEVLGGYKGRRWMPVEDVAQATYDMIMDSPNPCQFSFMQPAIDDLYHVKLPNDIAELFYYCGRDEGFHSYVEKLVKPRTELFQKWRKDPELMKRAGTDTPRQKFSFWISGQLHVTDYEAMRRQHWYTRHHGIDTIMFYVFRADDMLYAGRIGCNCVMAAGRKAAVLMTDRSLAWHDLREDMALITLVRLLKERADAPALSKVETLERQAYAASQRNEFDLARHRLVTAVKMMEPEFAELACPDFYQPVAS